MNVADFAFSRDKQRKINRMVSLGASVHDGHPDYQRTIKRVDEALYQAKKGSKPSG